MSESAGNKRPLLSACSRHAGVRMQQRAVPPVIVEWLHRFGTEVHDHHGGIVCYFDKAARRRAERALGRVAVSRMKQFLNAYLVEADGSVVTVGRRSERIRRH